MEDNPKEKDNTLSEGNILGTKAVDSKEVGEIRKLDEAAIKLFKDERWGNCVRVLDKLIPDAKECLLKDEQSNQLPLRPLLQILSDRPFAAIANKEASESDDAFFDLEKLFLQDKYHQVTETHIMIEAQYHCSKLYDVSNNLDKEMDYLQTAFEFRTALQPNEPSFCLTYKEESFQHVFKKIPEQDAWMKHLGHLHKPDDHNMGQSKQGQQLLSTAVSIWQDQ
jgi:hypothetical protein